jgi:hypothetical protein
MLLSQDDKKKDKNAIRTLHSAQNEQKYHQHQVTHGHVTSRAFVWSSFPARTTPLASASSGIAVENPGE